MSASDVCSDPPVKAHRVSRSRLPQILRDSGIETVETLRNSTAFFQFFDQSIVLSYLVELGSVQIPS